MSEEDGMKFTDTGLLDLIINKMNKYEIESFKEEHGIKSFKEELESCKEELDDDDLSYILKMITNLENIIKEV